MKTRLFALLLCLALPLSGCGAPSGEPDPPSLQALQQLQAPKEVQEDSYVGMLRATNGYKLRKLICQTITYPFYYPAKDYTCVRQAFILKRLWDYAGIA